MILNTDRKLYLFTIEDIAMVDLLAHDEVTERVAIPQVWHDGNDECEQGGSDRASDLAIIVFPIPGTSSIRTCPSLSRATRREQVNDVALTNDYSFYIIAYCLS